MKTEDFSRRDFLRMGAVAGVSAAALGALAGCSQQEPVAASEPMPETGDAAAPEAQPEPAADAGETAGDTIYIVDHIECKPGDGKAMFEHYMSEYVPGAQQRGMTLVNSSVNPPIWLTDEDSTNTLEFVWSVAGMMGWAGMVGVSRYDPEMAPKLIDFWYDVDDRVVSRTRTLSAPDSDVESLTTLARLGA